MSAPSSSADAEGAAGAGRNRGGAAPAARAAGGCSAKIEEYFIETLTPGDTFVFAGEVLRFEASVETR
jgi:ATP-dependent helicase Lhr and Lhr-like helicase